MTGAPKYRTMRIIEELEQCPRGPYAGSLGYLSVSGAADLNIVIRTAVLTPRVVSVGTGGAVVAGSTATGEYEEMLLKARAVVKAVAAGISASTAAVAAAAVTAGKGSRGGGGGGGGGGGKQLAPASSVDIDYHSGGETLPLPDVRGLRGVR